MVILNQLNQDMTHITIGCQSVLSLINQYQVAAILIFRFFLRKNMRFNIFD